MDEIKRKAQEGVMEISIDLEKLLADIKRTSKFICRYASYGRKGKK